MRVRLFTLALAEVRLDLHSTLSTYCATKWRRIISMATLQVYCRRYPAGRAGLRACQPGRRWSIAGLRLPEMTGVYGCLCEAVCDVTTLPSHLKNLSIRALQTILSDYINNGNQKRSKKRVLLNTNGTVRPHGLPQQNREQNGRKGVTLPVPRQ